MFEIAAENAAAKEYVRGPGSFIPALLDELWAIREQTVQGSENWLAKTAKIHQIQV
jgi:thiamine-phosphate diphosphorylase/hydroxyethylthiazole kinase